MKLNTILWSSTLALALSFGTLACKPTPPEGTTPPDGTSGGATDGGGGGDGGASDGGGGDGGSSDGGGDGGGGSNDPYELAKTKECPADINQEAPVPMFADSILVRLPKNVPEFVEENPFFARMNPPGVESVGCVEGVPGATINRGFAGYFETDANKKLADQAKETLVTLAYPEGSELADIKEGKSNAGGASFSAVVDVPADDKNPEPAKVFIVMKAGYGRTYWMLFECHPAAWNALKASFVATGDSMLLLNTGG